MGASDGSRCANLQRTLRTRRPSKRFYAASCTWIWRTYTGEPTRIPIYRQSGRWTAQLSEGLIADGNPDNSASGAQNHNSDDDPGAAEPD
jgi:hypothetical protein